LGPVISSAGYVLFQEVKTWLTGGGTKSLPLPPECTADLVISMVERVLSAKSSFLAAALIDALNESSLPDFILNRGKLSYFAVINCFNVGMLEATAGFLLGHLFPVYLGNSELIKTLCAL